MLSPTPLESVPLNFCSADIRFTKENLQQGYKITLKPLNVLFKMKMYIYFGWTYTLKPNSTINAPLNSLFGSSWPQQIIYCNRCTFRACCINCIQLQLPTLYSTVFQQWNKDFPFHTREQNRVGLSTALLFMGSFVFYK